MRCDSSSICRLRKQHVKKYIRLDRLIPKSEHSLRTISIKKFINDNGNIWPEDKLVSAVCVGIVTDIIHCLDEPSWCTLHRVISTSRLSSGYTAINCRLLLHFSILILFIP